MLRPDSAHATARYAGSGPTVWVNQGAIKVDFTKVDVLTPDTAVVTTTITGTATDAKMGKPSSVRVAYTAVLRLQHGQILAVQQHQSFSMREAK